MLRMGSKPNDVKINTCHHLPINRPASQLAGQPSNSYKSVLKVEKMAWLAFLFYFDDFELEVLMIDV